MMTARVLLAMLFFLSAITTHAEVLVKTIDLLADAGLVPPSRFRSRDVG